MQFIVSKTNKNGTLYYTLIANIMIFEIHLVESLPP